MDTDAIVCAQVSKAFPRYGNNRFQRFKDALLGRGRTLSSTAIQWALTEVNLRVERGRLLGVIGETGAGKSTLLRVMSGLDNPDEGAVRVNGRSTATLYDTGFGLRARLSGRKNILANRAIGRLAHAEVADRVEQIVAFSEANDFIDAPVRTYSTGMRMKLGFAIALHSEADILLIDNLLGTGDEAFQKKCLERIEQLKTKGAAIVLVSHDIDTMEKSCDEVLWLASGRVHELGKARRVLRAYQWHSRGTKQTNPAQTTRERRSAPPAPFIIWTFRRTGGTHLGQALFDQALFDDLQHEPFNQERVYGNITRSWIEESNEPALRHALGEICGQKWLIKHCLEMVPETLNRVLAEVSSKAGYRHLFLYRRNPLDRLLSLEFATRSGVWGKEPVARTSIDESVFSEPLPIDHMVQHERTCRHSAQDVYTYLRQLGQRPVRLAFEDLFLGGDLKRARRHMHAVLAALGLARGGSEDDTFVARALTGGDQGTRDHYGRFSGYEQLREALTPLGEFDLQDAEPILERQPDMPDWVERCEIREPAAEPLADCYTVGGAVIVSRDTAPGAAIFVDDSEGRKPAVWGLPSQRMAGLYPENPRAAHARFEVQGIVLDEVDPARLILLSPNGEATTLARLSLASKTRHARPRDATSTADTAYLANRSAQV